MADLKRIKSLNQVGKLIEAARPPFGNLRKLNGILGALTMQYESGETAPEITAPLVSALRAALLLYLGEQTSRPALTILEKFA